MLIPVRSQHGRLAFAISAWVILAAASSSNDGLRPAIAVDASIQVEPGDRPPAIAAFPKFTDNAPYSELRRKLLEAGWQPASNADADRCEPGDTRCEGRSEMQSCAGTGEGNCLFLWRKGDAVFAVSTIGDPALVAAVECRSHCR